MSIPTPAGTTAADPHSLADDAVALTRRWLVEASTAPVDPAAARLAGMLRDPHGLEFTVGFVDGVVRPEDRAVAARNLRELAGHAPAFLPRPLRAVVAAGGALAPVLPGIVIPIARRVLRAMVGHLIVDATDAGLTRAIAALRGADVRLNINLLGEAILGADEAGRRLSGTYRLLARDDVDYVSIKVSSTVAPHSRWSFDAAVEHVIDELTPLYRLAASSRPRKFINLDMEEYTDLDLTMAVFTGLLSRPEFHDLEAGIVLQAYLPDALAAMIRLQTWAAARTRAGRAPIKVRVVKGANLPMERVDASLHGWPLATWPSKQDTDTSYKALLDYALTPDRIANVRLGVAGHNLFDIALAHLLAGARGVDSGLEFEMLLGMAAAQAEAVRRTVGSLLLYTPVVHPKEFEVAIAYLVRRLEEGASQENFLSAAFDLDRDDELFDRERRRFLASVAALGDEVPVPNRRQDRTGFVVEAAFADAMDRAERHPTGGPGYGGPTASFANTPDTDPGLPHNRAWGDAVLRRAAAPSTLGSALVEGGRLHTRADLDAVMAAAVGAATAWAALTGAQRGVVLHRAGVRIESQRAALLEVMVAECGKTLEQGDPEVSEAVDFAHYYAELAKELDAVDGARFVPSRVTVVTPPWNFPVAIPAGSALAALAAGSAVVIKPARQAARAGAVLVDIVRAALAESGVDPDVLRCVQLSERELGSELVTHPDVDRLILTGAFETAELFRSLRHDLPLLAETSGKNAIVVTPSADLDLAALDVVQSAFGHAGQKCSAASLVVLVGSVATSRRFRRQLVDATRSLRVGYPTDATTQVGPLIEPAAGKLLRGLTTLEPGQTWLLEPRRLDERGRLWSPGIRAGVRRRSEFHTTEYFGPILGVMTVDTIEDAVAVVNDGDYGLTSGLHSLDAGELAYWLEHVQAGNLYVNRGITGAVVRRQPFGGWKRSAVGAGTKAGGPNYLVGLGSWRDAPISRTPERGATGPARRLLDDISAAELLDPADRDWVAAALASDAEAWAAEFGVTRDVSGLTAERNTFRYHPVPVTIRYEGRTASAGLAGFLRVLAAGVTAWGGSAARGASVVTTRAPLPGPVIETLDALGVAVLVEDDARWLVRLGAVAAGTGPGSTARIRLVGADPRATAVAVLGRPEVAIYGNDVVSAGRVELLTFLREQAVSVTAHRFGAPDRLSDRVLP